jgi:2-keto-4-pentenoate hydratase
VHRRENGRERLGTLPADSRSLRVGLAAQRMGRERIARRVRPPVPRPPVPATAAPRTVRRDTHAVPDRDASAPVDRGMRALLARRDAELSAGASPVGWKIGFNTPAIQQHFGIDEAVVGYLVDSGVVEPGATTSLHGWGKPAVEVELAIRVGYDGEVAGLGPALELVDLDISFHEIEPVLAGNVCHRHVVFGDEVPGGDPWSLVASVSKEGSVLAKDGRLTEDPATTVAFVRRFLAAHGAALESGDRIIAGSLLPPLSVAPGDEIDVSFGPFGSLRAAFSD